MPTIQQDVAQIRNAVYGREVREAIADGIEQSYAKSNSAATDVQSAIKYTAQSLTPAQKAQARENIGASENAVLYIEQTLTNTQKQQARTNIGVCELTDDSTGLIVSV